MKKTIKSKTIWFNILSLLAGTTTLFTPLLDAWIVDDEIKIKVLAGIIFVSGLLNMILRQFFTSTKLSVGGELPTDDDEG